MKKQIVSSVVIIAFLLIACGHSNNVEPTSTSIPPTIMPSPTQDLTFSLNSGNTIPPGDVIQEVGFFGGAGGTPDCYGDTTDPYMYEDDYGPDYKYELMQQILVILCNLPENADVNVITSLPDNTTRQEILKTNDSGKLFYYYVPLLDSPAGMYTFSFDSSEDNFEKSVEVVRPDGPRLYLTGESMDESGERRTIILYNFLPREKIRLFAYKGLKLAVWREFIADDNGMVVLQNQFEKYEFDYAAIGDVSGVAYDKLEGWGSVNSEWLNGEIFCEGAPLPISGIHSDAEVIVVSDQAFVKYGNFDAQGNTTFHQLPLPRGTELKIWGMSSPYCADNAYWWSVRCQDISNGEYCNQMSTGAIAEQIGEDQFIEPTNK
jgi:hypothetical protein